MNLSANNFNLIWDAFCLCSVALSWTVQAILYRKIKKGHFQKWIEIGEPGLSTMISNNASKFRKARLTLKYFIHGDAELDADRKIRKLKRINQVIFLGVFILAIILVVVSIALKIA